MQVLFKLRKDAESLTLQAEALHKSPKRYTCFKMVALCEDVNGMKGRPMSSFAVTSEWDDYDAQILRGKGKSIFKKRKTIRWLDAEAAWKGKGKSKARPPDSALKFLRVREITREPEFH